MIILVLVTPVTMSPCGIRSNERSKKDHLLKLFPFKRSSDDERKNELSLSNASLRAFERECEWLKSEALSLII